MSHSNKQYSHSHNNRNYIKSYQRQNNISQRQRQRSRNKFNTQRLDHQNKKGNEKSNHIFFDQKNRQNHQNKKNVEYKCMDKIARQVQDIDIGNPKIYLIWKHPKESQKHQNYTKKITFKVNIIKGQKPPQKVQPQSSRLSQLKNDITPVQQIWGQLIKQYLNDSQFVQIHRKRNSLSYGQIQYSKTMIQYDGLEQKKFYDNQESQYNIFSRAYFKLWQILSLGILQSKRQEDVVIANLAQGPGGFIHSLIDFRLRQNKTLQDRFYAITLKIQAGKTRMAKDWSDYRGQAFFQAMENEGYKVKLSYGQTGDGNLYNTMNIDSFKIHVMQGRQAFLVTGDGGIQCIGDDQFHYQEIFNAKLFFAQILTAFRIQEKGGAFILKIYDIHFRITVQLLMLLSVYYRKVGNIKPLTSRPGNSQKYVLCQGFLGIDQKQLSQLTQLLNQWHRTQSKLSYFENTQYLQSILSFHSITMSQFQPTICQRINLINTQLAKQQQIKIQEGLQLIRRHNGSKQLIKREIKEKRLNYQLSYAYEWCRKYGLKTVDVQKKTQV